MKIVVDLAGGPRCFDGLGLKVRIGALHPLDAPVRPAGVADADGLFGPGPRRYRTELDDARLDDDVATDIDMDGQTHFGRKGLVEVDRQRGVLLAQEGTCVDLGDNVGLFPGL